jgi:hypothetical protein
MKYTLLITSESNKAVAISFDSADSHTAVVLKLLKTVEGLESDNSNLERLPNGTEIVLTEDWLDGCKRDLRFKIVDVSRTYLDHYVVAHEGAAEVSYYHVPTRICKPVLQDEGS